MQLGLGPAIEAHGGGYLRKEGDRGQGKPPQARTHLGHRVRHRRGQRARRQLAGVGGAERSRTAFGGREQHHHLRLVDRTGARIGQDRRPGCGRASAAPRPGRAPPRARLRKPARTPPRPRSRSTRIWPVSPSVSTSAKNAAAAGGSPAGSREAVARSGGPARKLSAPTSAKGTSGPRARRWCPSRMTRSYGGGAEQAGAHLDHGRPQLAGRVLHRRRRERERGCARLHLRRREVGVAGETTTSFGRGTRALPRRCGRARIRGRRPRRGADAQAERAVLAELELGDGARPAGSRRAGRWPDPARGASRPGPPPAFQRRLHAISRAPAASTASSAAPSHPYRSPRGYGAAAGGAARVDRRPSAVAISSRWLSRRRKATPGAGRGGRVVGAGTARAWKRTSREPIRRRGCPSAALPSGAPRHSGRGPRRPGDRSGGRRTRPPRTADRMPTVSAGRAGAKASSSARDEREAGRPRRAQRDERAQVFPEEVRLRAEPAPDHGRLHADARRGDAEPLGQAAAHAVGCFRRAPHQQALVLVEPGQGDVGLERSDRGADER